MKQTQMIPMQLRLPADCKAFIEGQAAYNASSQNSEIVRLIRAAMSNEKTAAGVSFADQPHAAVRT